jgi:hypothetical protein
MKKNTKNMSEPQRQSVLSDSAAGEFYVSAFQVGGRCERNSFQYWEVTSENDSRLLKFRGNSTVLLFAEEGEFIYIAEKKYSVLLDPCLSHLKVSTSRENQLRLSC